MILAELQIFLQVLLAASLGALVGLEREYKKKDAGLRTFSLVALGSCFLAVIGKYLSLGDVGMSQVMSVDPTRVIQAVAIGIGFIGSGIIIKKESQIDGLTTAAGLWAVSAIGVGVGLGLYWLSVFSTILIISVLLVLSFVEKKLLGKKK